MLDLNYFFRRNSMRNEVAFNFRFNSHLRNEKLHAF